MYNYDFYGDNVLLEFVNNLVSIDECDMKCNIIITNNYLMLFKNIKEHSALSGREVYEIPEYELFIKMAINEIEYNVDSENTIINFAKKEIILYNFDLSKVKLSIFSDKSAIN